ncbi:MAG TPA: hypothetical protein VKS60_12755 [Stellaceae bacterium]|nr:hypothetical protein [Stellaceae bacterium]
MKFPVFILATPGATTKDLDRFVPREWKGDLVDDMFEAQSFQTAAAAARRLEDLTKVVVRSDIRTLAIFQVNGVSVQRLSQPEQEAARDQALDEEMRNKMSPDVRDYFARAYSRR